MKSYKLLECITTMCVTQVSQFVLHIANYGYQPIELEKRLVL